jgi:TonB family protein
MNAVMEWMAGGSETALRYWLLWNAQTLVFTACILIADLLSRNAPLRFRAGLWLIALVKAFVPPIIPLAAATRMTDVLLQPVVAAGAPARIGAGHDASVALLLAMIVVASCAAGSMVLWRWIALRRLLRDAHPFTWATDPRERWPEIRVSDRIGSPLTLGLLRPRIYLNADLASGPSELMHAVLYHELAHVRRRDVFVVAIQTLGIALFPLNPALWIIASRAQRYREQLCDAWSMKHSGARPAAYGRMLIDIAEHGMRRVAPQRMAALQPGMRIAESRRALTLRILQLFRTRRENLTAAHMFALALVFLLVLPLSCKWESSGPTGGDESTATGPAWDVAPAFDSEQPLSVRYPADAKAAGLEGMVLVAARVLRSGEIARPARVVRSSAAPALDRAAVRAVEQARMHPALKNGKAVEAVVTIPIRFRLQ